MSLLALVTVSYSQLQSVTVSYSQLQSVYSLLQSVYSQFTVGLQFTVGSKRVFGGDMAPLVSLFLALRLSRHEPTGRIDLHDIVCGRTQIWHDMDVTKRAHRRDDCCTTQHDQCDTRAPATFVSACMLALAAVNRSGSMHASVLTWNTCTSRWHAGTRC
jgi:hypothetical protein